jgi:hypothetical protein
MSCDLGSSSRSRRARAEAGVVGSGIGTRSESNRFSDRGHTRAELNRNPEGGGRSWS